jgi:16S rRNA (uracil1498-N3)-methyltransferase
LPFEQHPTAVYRAAERQARAPGAGGPLKWRVQPRAYAPDLDPSEKNVALSAEESGHLIRVLRLDAGARVVVFDGRGAQYLARITTAAKDRVTLALLDRVPPAPEPRVRLTLAQAVLKGEKMDAVVRDATMMGVSAVIPLITERTVIPRSALEIGRVRERWHRIAVSSAKQCGRAIVPEIGPPERLTALFEASPDAPDVMRLQLVEPGAAVSATDTPRNGSLPPEPSLGGTLIAIGPEGGWSPEVVEQAREAGWQQWTLGARTLRAESAPLAALSILTYLWRL